MAVKSKKRNQRPGPGRPPGGEGDLRAGLIRAGLHLLKEETLENVTLRKVAAAAGVSHVATYHHFENKNALLAAIAEEGFRDFFAEFETLLAEAGQEFYALYRGMGWTYMRFIIEQPQLARIMFGGTYLDYKQYPRLRALSLRTYRTLRRIVARGIAEGKIAPGQLKAKTLASWSMIHGMAMLVLEGRLKPGASIDATRELARSVTEYVYTGMMARPTD